jgi:hypothetical protein
MMPRGVLNFLFRSTNVGAFGANRARDYCRRLHMLTVTKRAAALLKAAKAVQGAAPETGIRIRRVAAAKGSGESAQTVGFTVAEQPGPGDE